MLKRSKLNAAVAIAIGGTAAVMGSAQAGVLYFPYVVNSATTTTIASVINTLGNKPGVAGEDQLHYIYYYKQYDGVMTDDEYNAMVCEEFNRDLPTSYHDIQSIDLSGMITSGVDGVLFNDPSTNNNWDLPGNDFALGRGLGAHRGVMLVEHASTMPNVSSTTMGLYGEAILFDWGNGASWGYQAFANPGFEEAENTGADQQYDFTNDMSASPSYVALFPFENEGAFATKFMVTPQFKAFDRPDAAPASASPGAVNANTASIWLSTEDFGAAAAYDRDENPWSGTRKKSVTCVGAVRAQDLVTAPVETNLGDGGWAGVNNAASFDLARAPDTIENDDVCTTGVDAGLDTTGTCSSAAIIFKVEYGSTSSIEPGTDGTYNNGLYLRPSDAWGQEIAD